MSELRSPIRRILVALDDSPSSRFAIRTAIDLALRFKAQIVGLFVEDINLLRMAHLPFVREIGLFSIAPRRVDIDELERQLRSQAERIRRVLAAAAEAHGITWELLVKRGPVALEVMTSGADADLMVLGRVGRSYAQRRLGTTMRSILLQRPGLTFVLSAEVPKAAPVIVLYDGSEGADQALDIAATLVASDDDRLSVVLIAESREASQRLHENASRRLAARGVDADYRVVRHPSLEGLAWWIRTLGSGLLVLPCGGHGLQGEGLCGLVEAVPNPILLVK